MVSPSRITQSPIPRSRQRPRAARRPRENRRTQTPPASRAPTTSPLYSEASIAPSADSMQFPQTVREFERCALALGVERVSKRAIAIASDRDGVTAITQHLDGALCHRRHVPFWVELLVVLHTLPPLTIITTVAQRRIVRIDAVGDRHFSVGGKERISR